MKQNQKKKFRQKNDPVVIPDHLCTLFFLDAWDSLMEYRKQQKGKDTEYAQGLLLDKIRRLSGDQHDMAVELVQQAVDRKWISVFPLQKENNSNTQSNVYTGSIKQKHQPVDYKPIELTGNELFAMQKKSYADLVLFVSEHKKFPISWNYADVFFHLERVGEIRDSIDEKKIFLNQTIQALQQERKSLIEKNSSSETIWKKILESPLLLKQEARKRRCIKFFMEKFSLKGVENV